MALLPPSTEIQPYVAPIRPSHSIRFTHNFLLPFFCVVDKRFLNIPRGGNTPPPPPPPPPSPRPTSSCRWQRHMGKKSKGNDNRLGDGSALTDSRSTLRQVNYILNKMAMPWCLSRASVHSYTCCLDHVVDHSKEWCSFLVPENSIA